MRIKTLDCDFDNNQLEMFWSGNGDVYVSIYRDGEPPATVRIGMGGSGMHLPGEMGNLFARLATEFEKYKDFENERDAYMADFEKRMKKLKKNL